MDGSIEDNKLAYKKYKYVAPTPPIDLIDNTSFTIDFTDRKFIQVGPDPSNDFNVVIHVITASRIFCITFEFLKRIFSTMGHILSVILDPPTRTRGIIFLKDDSTLVTKMVYRRENHLVIESKNHVRCRILLNRENLLVLQDLARCIQQTVEYKSTTIRQIVMSQIAQIQEYLNKERAQGMAMIFDEVKQKISRSSIKSMTEPNFMPQLKMMAVQQVAERWYGHDQVNHKLFDISPPTSLLSPSIEPENRIVMDTPWVDNVLNFYGNFKEISM